MITFRSLGYMGRLGNQMFQYAALVATAKRLGVRWGIEFRNERIPKVFDPALQTRVFPRGAVKVKEFLELPRAFEITPLRAKPCAHRYREAHFHFDPEFRSVADNTDICGYFQSARYFWDCEAVVRREFTFREPIRKAADAIRLPRDWPLVSIHVRRGDYLRQSSDHFVDLWTDGYYQRAIAQFPGDAQLVCFSDEPEWCRANLPANTIFVNSGSPYIDLCLMSQCDHHITANSSYSWWGAWLNSNPDKRVIAPKRWFGPALARNDTRDVCCAGWVQV